MWVVIWLFNVNMVINAFPHILHIYGFSPVWILRCIFKWHLYKKALPQLSHLKDFSLGWVYESISDTFPVDPESKCSLLFRSWLSAPGELWERSWCSPSGSLWSLSSPWGVNMKGSVSCFSTSCSPSWLVHISSCSSLICGGSCSSGSRLELLSWRQSCWSVRTSSSLQTCCCGSSGGTKRHKTEVTTGMLK